VIAFSMLILIASNVAITVPVAWSVDGNDNVRAGGRHSGG
jgi:hypothetical protein